MKIPIIIMTRNEDEYLNTCVNSIINTISIDYHIYIIDNRSDSSKQKKILSDLENQHKEKLTVIRNKNNLWILGINATLREIKKTSDSKYFFLTDGDIDFSHCNCNNSPCWMSYLISNMEKNISIGKLGLSLSWDYLLKDNSLQSILKQEKSLYSEQKKINDLYVSAIDTTATLYRWDWSIENSSQFYPDHMRYLRPELYSCRTPRNITVEHLGWKKYNSLIDDKKSINSKVVCFTIVGGDIKKQILNKASIQNQFFYKLFSYPILKLWTLRRYMKLFIYFFKKGIHSFDGQNSN